MAKKGAKTKKDDFAGGVFFGSIILGVAFGMLYGNVAVGSLIGLGVGFILHAIIKAYVQK